MHSRDSFGRRWTKKPWMFCDLVNKVWRVWHVFKKIYKIFMFSCSWSLAHACLSVNICTDLKRVLFGALKRVEGTEMYSFVNNSIYVHLENWSFCVAFTDNNSSEEDLSYENISHVRELCRRSLYCLKLHHSNLLQSSFSPRMCHPERAKHT